MVEVVAQVFLFRLRHYSDCFVFLFRCCCSCEKMSWDNTHSDPDSVRCLMSSLLLFLFLDLVVYKDVLYLFPLITIDT